MGSHCSSKVETEDISSEILSCRSNSPVGKAINDSCDPAVKLEWDQSQLLQPNPVKKQLYLQLRNILIEHRLLNKSSTYSPEDLVLVKEYAFQMLDIMIDHDCCYFFRDLDNPENFEQIFDRSKIKHTLTIETNVNVCYWFDELTDYTPREYKTTITLSSSMPPDYTMPYKYYLCRHIVQIPFLTIMYQAYGFTFPSEIAATIGHYLYETENGYDHNFHGLCYGCLSHHDQDQEDVNSDILKYYLDSKNGDIQISFAKKTDKYRLQAFNVYYAPIIDSYNKKIDEFVSKNKFYNVIISKSKSKPTKPTVTHSLIRVSNDININSYKLKAKFQGFNNLNSNEAATVLNTSIESNEFKINMVSKSGITRYFDKNMALHSYCDKSKGSFHIDVENFFFWLECQKDVGEHTMACHKKKMKMKSVIDL